MNIGLFIGTQGLAQSFFRKEIIDSIIEKGHLKIFSEFPPMSLTEFDHSLKDQSIPWLVIERSSIQKQIDNFFLDFATLNRHKSVRSFETRVRWRYNILFPEKINFQRFLRFKEPRKYLLSLALLPVLGPLIFQILKKLNRVSKKSIRKWSKLGLGELDTLIILTGGAFGGPENRVLNYCRSKEVKSILVVDNWDNLTSKSIYSCAPSVVAVWGDTMADDALNVQKFTESKVIKVGSSRVNLESTRILPDVIGSTSPYIYFVTSGKQWCDEGEIVACLSEIVAGYSKDIKIVVRPHPYFGEKGGIDKFVDKIVQLPNVEIDEFIDGNNFYSIDALKHIERQLRSALFVVGTHSTLIVEALFYGKYVIAMSSTTSRVFRSGDVWEGYNHLQQVRNNEGLREIRELSQLETACRELLEKTKQKRNHDNFIPHIIPTSSAPYERRFASLIEQN